MRFYLLDVYDVKIVLKSRFLPENAFNFITYTQCCNEHHYMMVLNM